MEVARAGAPRLNRSRRCVPAASVAWCALSQQAMACLPCYISTRDAGSFC